MRRYLPEAPYGREEFLYFVLSCNDSVESIINQCVPRTSSVKLFSSDKLAEWTLQNWDWAVEGAISGTDYVNVLYSHSRILNSTTDGEKFLVAQFRKDLPVYQHFKTLSDRFHPL